MTLEEQIAVIRNVCGLSARIKGLSIGADALADGSVIAWAQIRPGRKKRLTLTVPGGDLREPFFELVCAAIEDSLRGGPLFPSD